MPCDAALRFFPCAMIAADEMSKQPEAVYIVAHTALIILFLIPELILGYFVAHRRIIGYGGRQHTYAGLVGNDDKLTVTVAHKLIFNCTDIAVGEPLRLIATAQSVGKRHIALSCPLIRHQLVDRAAYAFAKDVHGADDTHAACKVIFLAAGNIAVTVAEAFDIQRELYAILKPSRLGGYRVGCGAYYLCLYRFSAAPVVFQRLFGPRKPAIRPYAVCRILKQPENIVVKERLRRCRTVQAFKLKAPPTVIAGQLSLAALEGNDIASEEIPVSRCGAFGVELLIRLHYAACDRAGCACVCKLVWRLCQSLGTPDSFGNIADVLTVKVFVCDLLNGIRP